MARDHEGIHSVCHRPRKRTIQYAVASSFISKPLEYWMPCFRGARRLDIGVLPFRAHGFVALRADGPRRELGKRLPFQQLRERPDGGTADQRTFVVQQPHGLFSQRRIARVADRDQHIADETEAADALDRRFCKSRAKRRIVKPCEISKRWRAQVLARGELALAPRLRELVPWANRKAIVAAIDAVADRFAEFARDRPLALDRQVGDAAPGIELVGSWKRRRRADVGAGRTGAAMIGLSVIAGQIERGEDRAQKQPGAEFARDEVG